MSTKTKTPQVEKLQIKIRKNKKNELELEFFDRFTKKINAENVKILTDDGWIQSGKDLFHKDVSTKELPEVLQSALLRNGVDAYTYEPHPLVAGYRLHINTKNPKRELKKAIANVEKDWNKFQSLLLKKLK